MMERVKELGFKLTPQRLAIVDYLKDNTDHPSAEDIYAAVSKRFPTMSFATVYNTLETLRQRGDLSELALESGRKRFDPNPHPHHHLICTSCKKIVDVHTDYRLSVPVEERADFEIAGSRVEFYGLCGKCRKKNK